MARGKQITKQITKTTSECLEIFLKHCQTKNLSKPTLKTYRLECNSFNEWYGEEQSIYDVSAETIEEYISFLQEKEISQTYIATKIRQLRAFLYFCMEREYLKRFSIKIPKADEVIKEPYTQAELEKLIRKPKTSNWVEWRNWAMVNYFFATGNRLSTVVNIKIADVDFNTNMILLTVTKNRKQQYIPMSSGLKAVLELYLQLWPRDML
jgi:integrase/recombinase XerD